VTVKDVVAAQRALAGLASPVQHDAVDRAQHALELGELRLVPVPPNVGIAATEQLVEYLDLVAPDVDEHDRRCERLRWTGRRRRCGHRGAKRRDAVDENGLALEQGAQPIVL
jgi:hypothetical protein